MADYKTSLDTFKKFVDFARQAHSGNDIALLNGQRVVKKTGDFIGNVGRGRDNVKSNNETRKAFLGAVKELCGGKLPKSVETALELENFRDNGKPLSARRVLAVNDAMQSVLNGTESSSGPEQVSVVEQVQDANEHDVANERNVNEFDQLPEERFDVSNEPDQVKVDEQVQRDEVDDVKHDPQTEATLRTSFSQFGRVPDDEEFKAALRLMSKYSTGLPEKKVGMLANFICGVVHCAFIDEQEEEADESVRGDGNSVMSDDNSVMSDDDSVMGDDDGARIERMKANEEVVGAFAKELAEWREFDFGDETTQEICEACKVELTERMKDVHDELNSRFHSSLSPYDACMLRTEPYPSIDFSVGGKTFYMGNGVSEGDAELAGKKVANEIEGALRGESARMFKNDEHCFRAMKYIQTVFSKCIGMDTRIVSDTVCIRNADKSDFIAPKGTSQLIHLGDSEKIGSISMGDDVEMSCSFKVTDYADKEGAKGAMVAKTATLDICSKGRNVAIFTNHDCREHRIGQSDIHYRITLDLTKEIPEITNLAIKYGFNSDASRSGIESRDDYDLKPDTNELRKAYGLSGASGDDDDLQSVSDDGDLQSVSDDGDLQSMGDDGDLQSKDDSEFNYVTAGLRDKYGFLGDSRYAYKSDVKQSVRPADGERNGRIDGDHEPMPVGGKGGLNSCAILYEAFENNRQKPGNMERLLFGMSILSKYINAEDMPVLGEGSHKEHFIRHIANFMTSLEMSMASFRQDKKAVAEFVKRLAECSDEELRDTSAEASGKLWKTEEFSRHLLLLPYKDDKYFDEIRLELLAKFISSLNPNGDTRLRHSDTVLRFATLLPTSSRYLKPDGNEPSEKEIKRIGDFIAGLKLSKDTKEQDETAVDNLITFLSSYSFTENISEDRFKHFVNLVTIPNLRAETIGRDEKYVEEFAKYLEKYSDEELRDTSAAASGKLWKSEEFSRHLLLLPYSKGGSGTDATLLEHISKFMSILDLSADARGLNEKILAKFAVLLKNHPSMGDMTAIQCRHFANILTILIQHPETKSNDEKSLVRFAKFLADLPEDRLGDTSAAASEKLWNSEEFSKQFLLAPYASQEGVDANKLKHIENFVSSINPSVDTRALDEMSVAAFARVLEKCSNVDLSDTSAAASERLWNSEGFSEELLLAPHLGREDMDEPRRGNVERFISNLDLSVSARESNVKLVGEYVKFLEKYPSPTLWYESFMGQPDLRSMEFFGQLLLAPYEKDPTLDKNRFTHLKNFISIMERKADVMIRNEKFVAALVKYLKKCSDEKVSDTSMEATKALVVSTEFGLEIKNGGVSRRRDRPARPPRRRGGGPAH